MASAGAIALLFFEGGQQQAKVGTPKTITLVGGKLGGMNSLMPEARGLAAPGSKVINEKEEFLGCLGPDGINIKEDFCNE